MRGIIRISIALLIKAGMFSATAHAQKIYPAIGKPMPFFILKTDSIRNKRPLSSDNLRGKHYMLDFWNSGCSACVASFPKMNALKEKFGANLEIILVGMEERNRDIKKFFEVYRKNFNLRVNSVFDSIAFKKLVPYGVPHIIWVDDAGIVKAITSSADVTDNNVALFLKNVNFNFEDVSYNHLFNKRKYNKRKPLLIDGNGGDDSSYAFRTIFALWSSEMGDISFPTPRPIRYNDHARYEVIGAPIEILYSLAYIGTLSNKFRPDNIHPIPQFSTKANEKIRKRFTETQRFSYSIEIPYDNATPESLMKKMQGDLTLFFSLEATFVCKYVPCYNLTIIDNEKFSKTISLNGISTYRWLDEDTFHTFQNISIQELLSVLPSRLPADKRIPIVNKTAHTGRLSFDLKANIYNLESIQAGLRLVGLDLVPGTRRMKVLVITEGHQ